MFFTQLRASGNFKKNAVGQHQMEPVYQYGDSLTDKHSLQVPQTFRNVRSAPSTPEMESKPFPPRHAESTGQLEMHTNITRKQHSKSLSPELYRRNRKQNNKGSRRMSKSRLEKFHKLFKNIPPTEVPINYYSCAYFGDILLQGYMYVSANYICFYSKILGREKLIEIPVSKVLKITRERTAFIIPNAIGIVTDMEKYVFGSLIARDSTYSLMCKLWKLHRDGEISSISTKYDSELDTSTVITHVEDDNTMGSIHEHDGHTNPKIELTLGSSAESSSVESINISRSSTCSRCLHRQQSSSTGGAECMCDNAQVQSRENVCQSRKTSKTYSNMSYAYQCLDYGKTSKAMNHLVTKVQRLPRTSLLLGICSILVMFLTVSALMMLYKIVLLQAQLDGGDSWFAEEKPCDKIKMFSDVYFLRNQFHTATVERFHSVMQANLQVLDQVHESLKSLKKSTLTRTFISTEDQNLPPHT